MGLTRRHTGLKEAQPAIPYHPPWLCVGAVVIASHLKWVCHGAVDQGHFIIPCGTGILTGTCSGHSGSSGLSPLGSWALKSSTWNLWGQKPKLMLSEAPVFPFFFFLKKKGTSNVISCVQKCHLSCGAHASCFSSFSTFKGQKCTRWPNEKPGFPDSWPSQLGLHSEGGDVSQSRAHLLSGTVPQSPKLTISKFTSLKGL